MKIHLIGLFILFGLITPTWSHSFAASPLRPLPKKLEIPFVMDRNLIIIRASIDGQSENKYIFDTGTSGLTLRQTFATQNKLQGEGFTTVGRPNDPNPVQARNIVVSRFSIAGFETQNVAGTAVPDEGIFLPPGVVGIVSLSLLDGYCVTIDYDRSRLVLQRGTLKEGDPHVFPVNATEILETKLMVNGKEMPANLDSGGPESMSFPLEWKSDLTLKGEPVLFAKALTGSGEVELYRAQLIGKIVLGDIELVDPQITLVSGGFPAVNIGYPFLRQYMMSVDRVQGLIRLAPNKRASKG